MVRAGSIIRIFGSAPRQVCAASREVLRCGGTLLVKRERSHSHVDAPLVLCFIHLAWSDYIVGLVCLHVCQRGKLERGIGT